MVVVVVTEEVGSGLEAAVETAQQLEFVAAVLLALHMSRGTLLPTRAVPAVPMVLNAGHFLPDSQPVPPHLS